MQGREDQIRDIAVRKFSSHEEQEAEDFRYLQSRTPAERLLAVWEITDLAYRLKGVHYDASRRSEAIIARIQRAQG
jgi:hypothetical protein